MNQWTNTITYLLDISTYAQGVVNRRIFNIRRKFLKISDNLGITLESQMHAAQCKQPQYSNI